ncbi:MAG: hypothetical protein ACOCYU_05935, partial [Brevefilum sp.]
MPTRPVSQTNTVTATTDPGMTSTPSRTIQPTAVATATPTPVVTDVPLAQQLECGEVFCQV